MLKWFPVKKARKQRRRSKDMDSDEEEDEDEDLDDLSGQINRPTPAYTDV